MQENQENQYLGEQANTEQDFATSYLARLNHEKHIADLKNKGIIYMPVGSMKFTLMCLCVPFHLYEFWWLYRNFVCQKERDGHMLSPMWRVNLPLLYLRKLLEAMRKEGCTLRPGPGAASRKDRPLLGATDLLHAFSAAVESLWCFFLCPFYFRQRIFAQAQSSRQPRFETGRTI